MSWQRRNLVRKCIVSLSNNASPVTASDIATTLYPHQKKALTFLLEREREISGPDGSYPSLWQSRTNPWSRQMTWFHVITQKETFEEPLEAKGALLADDVCFATHLVNISPKNLSDGSWEDYHMRLIDRCHSRLFESICDRTHRPSPTSPRHTITS